MSSDSQKVSEFTRGSGTVIPKAPVEMSKDEVNFLTKMLLDEICELMATVHGPIDAKYAMIKMLVESKDIPRTNNVGPDLIAEQADAAVDMYYYAQNCFCKKGVNLSRIFDLVHTANMNKRDPATGQFLKRADGKVIKPPGWQEPDISAEILNQTVDNSL